MLKFKVGDRVRQVGDATWRGITGIYEGIRQDNYGYNWEYFTPDANSTFADGSSHSYAGELCGMKVGSFEPVEATPPIPAPIAERMRGLIERMADGGVAHTVSTEEARAIMAELVPVSHEVLIAREIVAQVHIASGYNNHDRTELDAGKLDSENPMRIALAAIRKGRELQKDGK